MAIRTVASGVLALFATLSLAARELPSIDEFAAGQPHSDARSVVTERARGLARAGQAIPVEARLRVPTFVWAARNESGPPAAQPRRDGVPSADHREETAARAHLDRFRGLYALDPNDVDGATVKSVHNTGKGPVVVKLRQQVNGIEIFREEMNVVLDRNLELVGISGYLSSASTPAARGKGLTFEVDERKGALAALRDLVPNDVQPTELIEGAPRGGYSYYTLPASAPKLEEPLRVKKVYFHLTDGLTPGYYVEVIARDPATNQIDAYAYVISAIDGHILFRNNLSASVAYTYRVWAGADGHPADSPAGNAALPKVNPVPDGHQPPFVGQTDITIANYPFSRNDPWLPAGATETIGNNVDAYSDIFYPDGYGPPAAPSTPATGDFRAQLTGTRAFQHTYDFTQPLHHVSRQAATTQLFVNINFLHDWFYDAGFDEAAGNAQYDNHGRGGLNGDRMLAEAQDGSGFDNANMYTPADGSSPRMQMYLWSGYNDTARFAVVTPAAIAGSRPFGTASFGPQTFTIEQAVVLPAPLSACSALTNASDVSGKIVLVDREPTSGADSCSIPTKLNNIAAAGAAGIVLVNLSGWPDTVLTLTDPMPTFTTPVMTISYNSATPIRSELAAGNVVTARMQRPGPGTARDSTIDNQVVFHEWGHYLSNRLIGNGNGLSANQARGMGEGWSDFLTILLEVRPDDVLTPSNATWNGLYMNGTFALSGGADGGSNQSYYYGVRRAPYTTDMTKNALTYKHTVAGVPLPAGMPIRPNGLSNSQYHNTGEIWALMLWECYASLLRDTQGASPRLTFSEAQLRMKEYLVAALKTTPVNPTILESRDALLAVAFANDRDDYTRFYQAFAKRGAGIGAVAADRFSTTNGPVVESFDAGGDAKIIAYAVTDTGGSCDNDGALDTGETGRLTFTLKNTGATLLNGMTGTLTSLTAGVTLPSGGAITFPDIDVLQSTTVNVPVAMASGISGIKLIELSLQYTHSSMDEPQTVKLTARGNTDLLLNYSATDTVDGSSTLWTVSSGTSTPVAPWVRVVNGVQSLWRGADSSKTSDERLESPPLTISSNGALKIEFDHLYGFESCCDGGVVEMSRNGGPWVHADTSAYASSYYSRFTGSSGSSPLHAVLRPAVAAGDVVRIRFRITTDGSVGGYGWDIDNITFTGTVETPFPSIQADTGCTKSTITRLTTNVNPARDTTSVTLTGTVVGAGTPAGTITFFDGATSLGTVPMVNRTATVTQTFAAGVHSLTARYDGASNFLPSTSAPLTQLVDSCTVAPTIGYLSPPTSTPAGSPVTLGVSATAPGNNAFSYTWYEGNAGDATNPIGTGHEITVRPTQTTKYWVRVRNGCGAADSVNIPLTVVQPARFYVMTPCRVYDSRYYYSGKLAAYSSRTIDPYFTSGCFPTSAARALALNVTVVAPPVDGFLTIYPADATRPATSTTNFRKGKTRANNGVISLSPDGDITIFNGSGAAIDFVIDVFGYFR